MAATALEGIEVSLEGTTFRAETDAEGRFSLRGNFEGDVTLVFQSAEGSTARIAVNVPAGGTLTLTNIDIDGATGEAAAEVQGAQFDGSVTAVDCSASTLTMRSVYQSANDTDSYRVRLDTSVLQDSKGNVLTCADLRAGAPALVQADVNADGSFGNGIVQVTD